MTNVQVFFLVFFIFFVLHHLVEFTLTLLNLSAIKKHAGSVPEPFKESITLDTYTKSLAYHRERLCFGLLQQGFDIVFVMVLIFSGFFGFWDVLVSKWFPSPSIFASAVYVLSAGALFSLIQLPFSIYSQFKIEEKYGFNKMTAGLFLADLLKSTLLGGILGLLVLSLLFWCYSKLGQGWWLWAFLLFFGFQLLMAVLYPVFLAPLFNKFTPLPDGSLKQSILDIAEKIQFKMSGVYTIDGSKRSMHSNAYFAGIGKARRIVLFDTLVKQLSEPEIVSVLAHEMGHNQKRHIQKQLIFGFLSTFAGFWILSYLIGWSVFYEAFGAGAAAPHKALLLLGLLLGHLTFWMTPLFNIFSRKYEYEADHFSREATGDSASMISALTKLSRENLALLVPHRLYSFYHYSHPTTLERIEALKRQG